jgi:Domain of unknown function (DUF4259)
MGIWGSQPFDNDSALDFLGNLQRKRKINRLAFIEATLRSYLAFDADPTPRALSESDLDKLEHELRASTRQINELLIARGVAVPDEVLRWPKSRGDVMAVVDMTGYGEEEALAAIGASALLLLHSAGDLEGDARVIAHAASSAVRDLLPLAQRTVEAILRNRKLKQSWNEGPRGPWRRQVQAMGKALASAAERLS